MPAHTKPPGHRRRKNTGQAQWQQLPREGRKGKAPALPKGKWSTSTREWWKTIWSSPMATVWQDADIDPLVRLARLREIEASGEEVTAALLAQMTAIEDRFGLSPKARRVLQWEITRAETEADPTPAARRHLRAVDPRDLLRNELLDQLKN